MIKTLPQSLIETATKILSESNQEKPLSFRVDNPGGEWLQNKKDDANAYIWRYRDSDSSLGKGISGSVTGYYNKPLNLPTKYLEKIPGAMGEEKYRGNPDNKKMKQLESEIGKPENFDSKKYPIFIAVKHKGNPYVMEGNHRLQYAINHNILNIHTEVRYFNGGEDIRGTMHPEILQKLHKEI